MTDVEMSDAHACWAYEDWMADLEPSERERLLDDIAREREEHEAFVAALDALMQTVPPLARFGDGQAGACLALIWKRFLPYRQPSTPKPAARKKSLPQGLRTKVFERDQYRCVDCGSHLDLACDHIIPESKGGATAYENLQTLCRSCNSRKGTRV